MLFAIALLAAARLRFALPRVPFADADAWGYLGPAVVADLTGDFPQVYGRNFLYPAFLRLVLYCSGDFAAITTTQHLLGLLGTVFFWSAWLGTRGWLPRGRWLSLLHDAIGLTAVACYAFGNRLIFHEHCLRPESLFAAASSVMLWLTVLTLTRPVTARTYPLLLAGHATWLAVLNTLHPSFGFAVGLGLLPPLVRVWCTSRRWWLRLLPLVVMPAALLFAEWMAARAFTRQDLTGQIFGPMTAFAFNADVVREPIDADLREPTTTLYPADFLRECLQRIDREFERTSREGRDMSTLAYNPDHFMYGNDTVRALVDRHFHGDGSAMRSFYVHYATRGMLGHLGMFLAKTGRNLWRAMGTDGALLAELGDPIDVPGELRATQTQLIDAYPRVQACSAGAAFAHDVAQAPRSPRTRQIKVAQRFTAACSWSFLALLLASVSLAFGLLLRQHHRGLAPGDQALLTHGAATCGLFAFNVGICFLVATVSCLDILRYSQNQVAFSVFAYASGCTLMLHALVVLGHRRSR